MQKQCLTELPTSHYSITCRSTFRSNNLVIIVHMFLSVSTIVVEEFCPTLLYNLPSVKRSSWSILWLQGAQVLWRQSKLKLLCPVGTIFRWNKFPGSTSSWTPLITRSQYILMGSIWASVTCKRPRMWLTVLRSHRLWLDSHNINDLPATRICMSHTAHLYHLKNLTSSLSQKFSVDKQTRVTTWNLLVYLNLVQWMACWNKQRHLQTDDFLSEASRL